MMLIIYMGRGYYKWVTLEFGCTHITLCALIETKHFGCIECVICMVINEILEGHLLHRQAYRIIS